MSLFADDAVLVDEGQSRRGTAAIRDCRTNVATVYEYTTELLDVQRQAGDRFVAHVRLDGNFPGGTVGLRYRFTIDGDKISRLEIAP